MLSDEKNTPLPKSVPRKNTSTDTANATQYSNEWYFSGIKDVLDVEEDFFTEVPLSVRCDDEVGGCFAMKNS
jgi:hypothetical protein